MQRHMRWQFTSVWMAVHHRTCRITAHRFPLVHIDICIPPIATYLQYRVIGLTPMAVGFSQSLAQRSGTVFQISSGTRQSALTLSDVCRRRICLHDTSACSTLEVDNFMRYINLLTYLQHLRLTYWVQLRLQLSYINSHHDNQKKWTDLARIFSICPPQFGLHVCLNQYSYPMQGTVNTGYPSLGGQTSSAIISHWGQLSLAIPSRKGATSVGVDHFRHC